MREADLKQENYSQETSLNLLRSDEEKKHLQELFDNRKKAIETNENNLLNFCKCSDNNNNNNNNNNTNNIAIYSIIFEEED